MCFITAQPTFNAIDGKLFKFDEIRQKKVALQLEKMTYVDIQFRNQVAQMYVIIAF